MSTPSEYEILTYMKNESKPYKFEYIEANQPLRISIERKTIYINKKVLFKTIENLMKHGLDWKKIMRYNIFHEKAHEKFYKWNVKWNVSAIEYGWLTSFLIDIVIDNIYLKKNKEYQNWIQRDYRSAFKTIKKCLWTEFPVIDKRPIVLYHQTACWLALDIISIDEAAELYAEKIDYILQLSLLFKKIKKETDLEWAFPKAKLIYLKMLGDL